MLSRRTTAGLVLAVVLVTGVALTPVQVLRVRSPDRSIATCRVVRRGDAFTLIFQNSIYGGDVRETFQVTANNALLRTHVITANAGAAEYYAWDGRVRPTPDGYLVDVPPRIYPELTIRVDQTGDHHLRFGDQEIALANDLQGSMATRIDVVSAPLTSRLTSMFGHHQGC